MKRIPALLLLALLSVPALAAEKITVVASIKPLQLVMHELLGEHADVKVLLPTGASPHHYSLKPSDIRKLTQADLVVWVGEDMEQFLVKPLQQADRPSLAAYQGEGGHSDHHDDHQAKHQDKHEDKHHDEHEEEGHHDNHDKHHDDHDEHHAKHQDKHDDHDDDHHQGDRHQNNKDEHGHHHHDHADDLHIWLDPIAMHDFAERVVQQLIQSYPQQEQALKAQLAVFQQKIVAADKQIAHKFEPYRQQGFVVFHDAFSSWVEHYGLKQLAYFTVDPARAIGARKLAEIQTLLKDKKAACVFREPQFEAAVVARVVEGTGANLGEIDPLANDNALAAGYSGYIQQLSENMINCLR